MAQTKISANILAAGVAQSNLNAGSSIALTKPLTSTSTANINGNFIVDTNTLFVDATNDRVGIGTITPAAKLHTTSITEQLRLGYDDSNYMNATVGSTGITTLSTVGSGAKFAFGANVEVTAAGGISGSTVKIGGVGMTLGFAAGGTSYSGVWCNQATPSFSNYTFLGDGIDCFFNATSSGKNYFRTGNATRMMVDQHGVFIPGVSPNANPSTQQLTVTPSSNTKIGVVVKGAVSQTANLQEWQDSNGVILGSMAASGNVGIGNTSPTTKLDVTGDAKVSGSITVGGTNTWDGSIISGAQTFTGQVRATGQTATTGDALITRDLVESLCQPSVENTSVVNYFQDFTHNTTDMSARFPHGGSGSFSMGPVSTVGNAMKSFGVVGLRSSSSDIPSSSAVITYANHSNQGHATLGYFPNSTPRKYVSRFILWGSANRSYAHYLIGNQTPNNNPLISQSGSTRLFGLVGCSAGTPLRQNSTAYELHSIITISDSLYRWRCTTAGTTAASQPTFSVIFNSTTTDGTAVWTMETINTNGFWAVISKGNHITDDTSGNQMQTIITAIPYQTAVAYRVTYDIYQSGSTMRAKAFIQSSTTENTAGELIELADMQVNNVALGEGPSYAIQREQRNSLAVIGSESLIVPWLEIDYWGMSAKFPR